MSLVVTPLLVLVTLLAFAVSRGRLPRQVRRWLVGWAIAASVMLCLLAVVSAAKYRAMSVVRVGHCRSNLEKIYEGAAAYRQEHGRLPPSLGALRLGIVDPGQCVEGRPWLELTVERALVRHRLRDGVIPPDLDAVNGLLRRLDLDRVPVRIYVPPRPQPRGDDVLVRDGPHTRCGFFRDTYCLLVLRADGRVEEIPYREAIRPEAVGPARRERWTPLHEYAFLNDPGGMHRSRTRVDVTTDDGWTPLHCAALGGGREAVEMLLDAGASVDPTDKDGATPLLIAAVLGHTDVTKLLLERGADATAKDNEGHCPLSVAERQGHRDLVRLLAQHGAEQ